MRRDTQTNSIYCPSPTNKNNSKMTEFGLNKLEKLSETDESDFYEDSKCHNIEIPMPEVSEHMPDVLENKLPDVNFQSIVYRNSTAESATISASHRLPGTRNPYKPQNLEAIKKFVTTSNSPRI